MSVSDPMTRREDVYDLAPELQPSVYTKKRHIEPPSPQVLLVGDRSMDASGFYQGIMGCLGTIYHELNLLVQFLAADFH